MIKRKIKLYIHHSHYEPITIKRSLSVLELFQLILSIFGQAIFFVCYAIGYALVLIPKTFLELGKTFRNPAKIYRTFIVQWSQFETRKSILIFIALIVGINLCFIGSQVMAQGQLLKTEVLRESTKGLGYLGEAASAVEANNYTQADRLFNYALDNFLNSQAILDNAGIGLKSALKIVPQGQDAQRLLEAIILITEIGVEANKNIQIIKNMKIGPQGLSGTDDPKASLETIIDFANDASKKVDLVSELINKINPFSLPNNQQGLFLSAKSNIENVRVGVKAFQGFMSITEQLLLGEHLILLSFLNNNELRPGGGFMGTIGSAKINNGVISELDVRTVYDFDGQLKELIHVPVPLLMANNRWFLRDTNWFADNRINAYKAAKLYEKSTNKKVDAVITITPAIVIEALKRTGPVSLPQHSVTLTAENFMETVQVATSITYDKFLNQPKQILADFMPALLQKISEEEDSIQFFLALMLFHLQEKNIQIFSFNKSTQTILDPYNWSGAILDNDRDYVTVNHANLGGTKTNNDLVTTLNLNTSVSADGRITNQLEYIVQNPLPNLDRLENKSFIRFLVPDGAKLISAEGFDSLTINDPPKDIRYLNDQDVKKWNDSLKYLQEWNIFTGQESEKNFFGGWLEVRGGETQTVKLKYELPGQLQKIDKYSLLIQKQVGSQLKLNYNLNHKGRKLSWHNGYLNPSDQSSATFSGSINHDQLISGVLLEE